MEELTQDRLLAGARNLKQKGYTAQQVDNWLKTHGSSLDDMKNFVSQSTASLMNPEALAQIEANNRAYDDKSHWGWNVAGGALSGAGEGFLSGMGRVASGLTFGASDWLDRKTGGNLAALDDRLQRRAENAGVGTLNKVAKAGTEIVGNIAPGGAITRGLAQKGVKSALAQSALGGGIGGTLYGATASDKLSDLPVNMLVGGVGGTVGGAALHSAISGIGTVGGLFRNNLKKGMDYIRKTKGDEYLQNMIDEATQKGVSLAEVADERGLKMVQMARQQTSAADDIITQNAQAIRDNVPNKNTDTLNDMFGTKSGHRMAQEAEQAAMEKARPMFNELESKGDLAKYETRDLPQQNFDRWFKGSQVVDENGQPRRYYHGSLRKFDEFKQANNDYNFAPDKKFAYNYAESKGFEQGIDAEPQLYEVFLNSKKPFDFENPEDIKNLSNYIKGKQIRVFGNPKKEEEFLRNLKGEYYDTKLDEGEFEKLLSDKYNKWYSPDNHDVNYSQSSVNTDKIFSVNPDEEYFITGSAPWGYNIDDVKSSQIEDAIKNLDFGKNKRHQIPVDIETPYGNRVINIDLKRIDKPSAKNLKRGADNWIDIESADFDGEDLLDALKNMGYDGYYKQENGVKNLSVFNPNQIKSVNNSGAWSSSPSLTDAGWTPESQSKLGNVINSNDVIGDAIKKVKGSYSSIKGLPDTDARVILETRKLLSSQTQSVDKTLAYQAKQALKEFDDALPADFRKGLEEANKIYKDNYQFSEAKESASDVFKANVSPEEFSDKFGKMTAEEKRALRGGLRDELFSIIENRANETLGWNRVVPRAVQSKIRRVMGVEEGNKLIEYAQGQLKSMRNLNKILGGSQTSEKQGLRDNVGFVRNIIKRPVDTLTGLVPYANARNKGIAELMTNPSADLARATYEQVASPRGWEAVYQALYNPRGFTRYNTALAAYLAGRELQQ